MAIGALVIWAGVVALGIYAVRTQPRAEERRRATLMIVGGGAVFPTVVLTALLIYGLWMLPPLVARAPEGSLRVSVAGEQWWWRVRYLLPGGEAIETANEIRLPVDEPVEFVLESSNVIHSFWIPSLGGKRDMIPGRVTHLTLNPTKTGVFRGACAEYCGTAHALMSFYVTVSEKAEFAEWLDAQARVAETPASALVLRGQEQFLANGCGACHSVRGTSATGVVGPDLTHIGSRLSIGAGILTNNPLTLERWISHPNEIKPGVHMPAFEMLPKAELEAIAVYLESLK